MAGRISTTVMARDERSSELPPISGLVRAMSKVIVLVMPFSIVSMLLMTNTIPKHQQRND